MRILGQCTNRSAQVLLCAGVSALTITATEAADWKHDFKGSRYDFKRDADVTVKVEFVHKATRDTQSEKRDDVATTFDLYEGEQDHVYDEIFGGDQQSFWDMLGVISTVDWKTSIVDTDVHSSPGYFMSFAIAPPLDSDYTETSSYAETTVTFSGVTASAEDSHNKIAKERKLGEGKAGKQGGRESDAQTYGYARGNLVVMSQGTKLVEMNTELYARSGYATIVPGEGLTLPGLEGTSGGFTSAVSHLQDPAQDYVWEVQVIDGELNGNGAGNRAWTRNGDNWFLPESEIPLGDDVTFSLTVDTEYEIIDECQAYEEEALPHNGPAVSEWGMSVITLLLVTGMTIKFGRRRGLARAA